MDAYIQLGLDHILDPKGYDHVLFILVLCALYTYLDWKKLLMLVTAFTVGHSFTLFLSGMKWINIDPELVEVLIPVTILLTAIYNIWKGVEEKGNITIHYSIALIFGLIHGLGFSNFFKSMTAQDESILVPLLKFNIGVELGQIMIVLAYVLFSWFMIKGFNLCQKNINLLFSIIGGLEAIRLIFF